MSTEAETTSATGTVATPAKVATPVKESPVKEGGSAPTTPSKETDEARIQLTQGRRHLLVKDYFSAVAALAKGCELLAQKFGDTAPELGDAYLTYGRALLELARSESGVLGMNEEGETAAEDDDEEDGEGEEGEDGEDEGEEGAEKDGAEAKENGEAAAADTKENGAEAKENGKDAETKANGTEAKENGKDAEAKENGKDAETKANGTEAKENGAEAKNGKDSEATNGKETNGAADPDQTLKEEEEEDDVNNLQLSWEVLELAKSIFQKQIEAEKESKQTCLKLAEVHLKLGEVGVESENYITAVEDMKACLELQKKYLDEDDRRIAETLYNMGIAYSLANEFDAAIEQYKSASVQIEKRIENLEKKKSEPVPEEKSATDDAFYTVQGEIDELKALLPEIKDKVSDMQDFKKETVRRMMDGLAEASAKQSSTADGAGPSSSGASDKPVSSVAHLVKRKPKEEVKEEAPAADKTEKMETSPVKGTEAKTEKVESSSAESTEEKTEKVESMPAESTEEKKADEEVSDRKRKPEDSVEVEDPTKKAKVEESTESKPSE